ncbi:MAG: SMC family ATPase [Candidatus Daviesbacteria bacterium]|nr:SMC family ATPase [Candidatus Daviesbacteria bacterium]
MIPVALKLANFTSYGEGVSELNFSKFHLAAISGLNGAGKSSLLDAITWCVWGTSRAGDNADQLVKLGSQKMTVEFSFELDGHIYTIKRARLLKGGGSTALELWSGSTNSPLHNLTEGTIKATQQKIINLLHLTFETFTNSSFLRQNHADEFTTKGPTDRKRILSDILGLSHYDTLEERAKEKVKELHSKLALLEYQLLEIEAEVSQKDESQNKLKEAQEKISQVEQTLKKIEEELKSIRETKEKLILANEQKLKLEQNLREDKIELNEILSQGQKRSARIKRLEEDIISLPEIDKKLSDLSKLRKKQDEINLQKQKGLELQKLLATSNGELAVKKQAEESIRKQILEIENDIKSLEAKGAKCPTCGQEIGKEHKLEVKKQLIKKVQDFEKELGKIDLTSEQNDIKKYQELLKNITPIEEGDLSKQIEQLEMLQVRKETLLKAKAELESEKRVVAELREFYKNKLSMIKKIELGLAKLPDVKEKLDYLNVESIAKEETLTKLREEEKEARNIFGQVKELMSRTQQLEKLQKIKLEEKNILEKEKANFEELALAFGKKGIQAMIIETAIPEIEEEANKLLERLTEGRMKVRFETQRETKTKMESGEKGIIETLDIIISDEMGEREYELYSGGEAFRVNFAIRIALSKLLTRRVGARLQFLVIDEGFGTQDIEGRTKIVEVLDTIKNDFEKILVITHLEQLKEEFPVRIEVIKGSSGSTFEVVGL